MTNIKIASGRAALVGLMGAIAAATVIGSAGAANADPRMTPQPAPQQPHQVSTQPPPVLQAPRAVPQPAPQIPRAVPAPAPQAPHPAAAPAPQAPVQRPPQVQAQEPHPEAPVQPAPQLPHPQAPVQPAPQQPHPQAPAQPPQAPHPQAPHPQAPQPQAPQPRVAAPGPHQQAPGPQQGPHTGPMPQQQPQQQITPRLVPNQPMPPRQAPMPVPAHVIPPPQEPRTVLIDRGGVKERVPVAARPVGILAAPEVVDRARRAPAVYVSPAFPPALPPRVDFDRDVNRGMRFDADHDRGLLRPRHWDFVDYDPYHRPFFFNPLDNDVSFRYFYGGGYRTVFVPAGGRVLIDAADAGVFPFTVAAAALAAEGANAAADAALLGVGNFLGGAFIPPNGYDGPPPPDYQPFTPVSYDQVPVYFAGPGRTAAVDHVTVVGHDEAAPAGMQDVFQLDNGTLARGQITQSPDAGTPAITVQATQTLPGISSWDDGRQYVDAQVTPVAKVSPSHMSWWLLSGAAAVLATICGIGVWVWRRFQRAGRSHEAAIGWASERYNHAGSEVSRTPVETG